LPAQSQPPRAKVDAKGKAAKPAPKAKRAKRGKLTVSVLEVLENAGEKGITIEEIDTKLSRNPAAIQTWFFITKEPKRKDVKKIGEAKWQWVGVSAQSSGEAQLLQCLESAILEIPWVLTVSTVRVIHDPITSEFYLLSAFPLLHRAIG
jgi:hypothetical protein